MLATPAGRKVGMAWAARLRGDRRPLMREFIKDATTLASVRQRAISGRDPLASEDERALLIRTRATRAGPGNKFYEHFVSVDDPDTIRTIEAFDDKAAGEAHTQTDHFRNGVDGDAKQYVAERPDIMYIDVPERDGWDKMSEF